MRKLKTLTIALTCILTSTSITISASALEKEKKASIASEWRVAADSKLISEYEKSVEYTKGNATGRYAVTLSDGDYYFYHQSSSGCANSTSEDGTWNFGNTVWGTKLETFTSTACPQYSLAMIVSNLVGSAETIVDVLSVQGCEFYVYADGTIYCEVDTSPTISKGDCGLTYSLGAADSLCNYYGLEHTDNLYYYGKDGARERINEVLDNGGMVLMRYGNLDNYGSNYGNESWPSRHTTGHYICIRNYDEDGYYLLDPCYNLCHDYDGGYRQFADKAVSWDAIWEHCTVFEGYRADSTMVGFWNPGDQASKSYSSDKEHWLTEGTAVVKRAELTTKNKSISERSEICDKKKEELEEEQKELSSVLGNKNKKAAENTLDNLAEKLFSSNKIELKTNVGD